MSVLHLWLPILLSGIAVFFLSFLSWMIVQLHKHDWTRLPNEAEFLAAQLIRDLPPGNYMFPMPIQPGKMDDEFQRTFAAGPWGSLQLYHTKPNMGANLGQTFVFFLVLSFCLGYLATLALPAGAAWFPVFRFVTTAAIIAYAAAIIPHAVWFRIRIVGHLLESLAFAAATGAIFASLWPK